MTGSDITPRKPWYQLTLNELLFCWAVLAALFLLFAGGQRLRCVPDAAAGAVCTRSEASLVGSMLDLGSDVLEARDVSEFGETAGYKTGYRVSVRRKDGSRFLLPRRDTREKALADATALAHYLEAPVDLFEIDGENVRMQRSPLPFYGIVLLVLTPYNLRRRARQRSGADPARAE